MLQVSLGGYKNIRENQLVYDDNPVYYEPGFNIMSPLEIEVPEADQIYTLIRKRTNGAGTVFGAITASELTIEVKDVTTGESIPATITSNTYNTSWNPESQVKIGLITNCIDVNNPTTRVRVLDCFIKDTTINDFINFRLLVSDSNKSFYYIAVDSSNINNRSVFSAFGKEAHLNINEDSDIYLLFSPFAYLKEVTKKEKTDFSYPLNSIFYQRQGVYSKEDFDFSIYNYSSSQIIDNISLVNVPYYKKAAVLLIDNHLYDSLLDTSLNQSSYISIKVVGVLSGIEEIFRVNFYKV